MEKYGAGGALRIRSSLPQPLNQLQCKGVSQPFANQVAALPSQNKGLQTKQLRAERKAEAGILPARAYADKEMSKPVSEKLLQL